MLTRLNELASRGESFALETTLSGTWLLNKIHDWKAYGYVVEMVFLRLPSPDIAVLGVHKRVAEGGHSVPDEVIRRRYFRGINLLESVYKPAVDHWIIYDNEGDEPRKIDEKRR